LEPCETKRACNCLTRQITGHYLIYGITSIYDNKILILLIILT
jgi:hypothetical protein